MAYIGYIAEEEAGTELAELYTRYRAPWGGVDNILRIHGPNPASMEAHVGVYRPLMFGPSPLKRRQREMLAVVVASANRCHY